MRGGRSGGGGRGAENEEEGGGGGGRWGVFFSFFFFSFRRRWSYVLDRGLRPAVLKLMRSVPGESCKKLRCVSVFRNHANLDREHILERTSYVNRLEFTAVVCWLTVMYPILSKDITEFQNVIVILSEGLTQAYLPSPPTRHPHPVSSFQGTQFTCVVRLVLFRHVLPY